MRADDFKCKSCGQEWYWTEEAYAENDRMKKLGVLAPAVGIATTHGSWGFADGVTNAALINKGAQAQAAVVDFSRCPYCKSQDIMQTGSHAIGLDNPFLNQSGQTSNYTGTPGSTQGIKKPLTAGLLGIFLGGFGAHKFYLGYSKEGAIMLAVWLIGLVAMAIPSIIMSIIGLIEGIIYLTKDTTAFQATYVQGHKGWF